MSFRRKLFEYERFDESWDVFSAIKFSRVAARYGILLLSRKAGLVYYWSLGGVLGLVFLSFFVDLTSSSYTEEEVS